MMLSFAVAIRANWCWIFAILFFVSGLFLRRGGSPEQYWPVATLSIAALILGVTHVILKANFFHVNDLCLGVISEQMTAVEVWGQLPERLASDSIASVLKLRDPERYKQLQEIERLQARRAATRHDPKHATGSLHLVGTQFLRERAIAGER